MEYLEELETGKGPRRTVHLLCSYARRTLVGEAGESSLGG